MQDEGMERIVIDDIVDNLLMGRSVLFVSDIFTYETIVLKLKECFEDINLYLFTFLEYDFNFNGLRLVFDKYDIIITYISSEEEKSHLQTIAAKNVIVY